MRTVQLPRTLYYLSDEAYNGLWRLAVGHKYVGRGAASGKGISQYITAASLHEFRDNRPEELRSMDMVRRAEGLTLYWSDGDARKARLLTLDEEVIEALCSVAIDHRIGIGKSHRKKSVSLRSTTSTVARVLEAIGKRWLIPTKDVPMKEPKENSNGSH